MVEFGCGDGFGAPGVGLDGFGAAVVPDVDLGAGGCEHVFGTVMVDATENWVFYKEIRFRV